MLETELDKIKLVKVETVVQEFFDGDTSKLIVLTFKSDDGLEVRKLVTISNLVKAVSNAPLSEEALYQVKKKIREAERDFAFMRYGKEWKKHVRWGSFWDADVKPEEVELVNSAVEMLVENA